MYIVCPYLILFCLCTVCVFVCKIYCLCLTVLILLAYYLCTVYIVYCVLSVNYMYIVCILHIILEGHQRLEPNSLCVSTYLANKSDSDIL